MNWRVGGTPMLTVIALLCTGVPPALEFTVFPVPFPSGSIPKPALTSGDHRMNGF